MNIKYFKKIKLSNKPGVYFFKKGKSILYIGKATSLKDRTKSYFTKDLMQTRGPLLVDMVFRASKLEWRETESVLEALILEAELIKKHQPHYNTKEKDDKSFNYVCITKPARNASHSDAGGEKLPKVIVVRGRNVQHRVFDKTYGPYTSGPQLREAVKIIRRIFPFLDDNSKNYLEFYKQINLVPDLNDRKLYMQNIRNIKLFFSGKKKQILKNLKKEMKNYAQNREFEKAGEIKRQMFALKHINDVALIKDNFFQRQSASSLRESAMLRIEAYDIAHMGGKNMVGVMTVVSEGEVTKNEYKKFKIRTQSNTNDTGALMEVLKRRLAHSEWQYPNLSVVDGGVAQLHAGMSVLKKFGIKIPVVSVLKDEKHKPKDILGDKEFTKKYKREILLSNSEAHRFAIAYHKNLRNRNFLK
jgi:excinuclease ABC subunit C